MTGNESCGRKHTSEDDDGGWTRIPAKGRRGGRAGRSRPLATSIGPESDARRTGDLKPATEIADEYRRVRTQWETTDACQALRRLVAGITTPPALAISRAVCLGIGTFDPPDGGWDTKRRTFVQLIAFLLMVESLEVKLGTKIKCTFQEPVFTEPDKTFIASLGHAVVESPQGFDLVTPDALLFGVHLYRPVYAEALSRSLPAIFVGTDLDVWDTVSLGQPDDLANGRVVEATYGKAKCPQDASSTAFSGTCIYWRLEDGDRGDLSTRKEDLVTTEENVAESPQNMLDTKGLAQALEAVTLV